MLRDLLKTGSFAVLHFSVGFGVTYLVSGSLPVALGVALIEPAVNTVVFFFHERAWAMTPASGDHHAFRHLHNLALQD